jgi:hypothetical protein
MRDSPDYEEYSNGELLAEMKKLSSKRTSEVGHITADKLLKIALRRASREGVDPEWADDFLYAYNRVGKWFA